MTSKKGGPKDVRHFPGWAEPGSRRGYPLIGVINLPPWSLAGPAAWRLVVFRPFFGLHFWSRFSDLFDLLDLGKSHFYSWFTVFFEDYQKIRRSEKVRKKQ